MPFEALVEAVNNDTGCGFPCEFATTPFPPATYCSGLTSNVEAVCDWDGTVTRWLPSLDIHPPPIYPRDMGKVVAIFREPSSLKVSFINYLTVVATDEDYAQTVRAPVALTRKRRLRERARRAGGGRLPRRRLHAPAVRA